jgi:hypothetical protein
MYWIIAEDVWVHNTVMDGVKLDVIVGFDLFYIRGLLCSAMWLASHTRVTYI